MNRAGNFHINGRYTLRGINDTWFVYDRESMNIPGDSPRWNTFTKAEKGLQGYIFNKKTMR